MEDKYIELLLKRCLNVDKSKPLFISYVNIIKDFVLKVQEYAIEIGISDIYLEERDLKYQHDLLNEITLEEIEKHEYFNASIWDDYAKKDAAFLMLESEIPGLMEDVDSEKLAKASFTRRKSKPEYNKKQKKNQIPWCIAAVPNKKWAENILEKSDKPLEEFWEILAKICMLDKKNPIESWNNLLENQTKIIEKLNSLQIKKLYFKNSLGTDLSVELPLNVKWQSASEGKWIVNMPSYEVFTTPIYKSTNGIVYSSKPLIYAGKKVNDFYIKFENGKVVESKAEEGDDVLKEIIASDEYSCYLGEVALVNYNSPISNTNTNFKTTLIDENASSHVALGSGFAECIKDSNKLSEEELKNVGVNPSKNHVDFMIGTEDLLVEADTINGKITIMKNGNLIL